jgi:hypothetical protein
MSGGSAKEGALVGATKSRSRSDWVESPAVMKRRG